MRAASSRMGTRSLSVEKSILSLNAHNDEHQRKNFSKALRRQREYFEKMYKESGRCKDLVVIFQQGVVIGLIIFWRDF